MENEERSSTGSTVSGVFKTILQSPTPICMFYFSHPFGVSTPQVRERTYSREKTGMSPYNTYKAKKTYPRERVEKNGYHYDLYQRNHVQSNQSQNGAIHLIPWPRNTWKRDFVLPPLIQFRGKRDDGLAPDLETVLKTIRQAWHSPTGYTNLQNQKYDTFCKEFANQNYVNKMGLGNKRVPTCSRLLKRRYSVPEIIMRKHELAQQKPYGNFNSESVPSSKIPPSTGISNSNSTSSISRNVLPDSPGSESNLSRTGLDTSLRKTSLLRQMWGKENRFRQGKTSSLRLLFQKGYSAEGTDSHCEECRRLNISRDDDDLEVNTQRYLLNGRLKQMKKPTSSETPSSLSDVSQLASQISTQESLGCKQESYTSAERPEICTTASLDSSSDAQKIEEESFYNSEIKEPSTISDQPETSSPVDDVESGDSTLDVFISQMLIENLHDLAEEARERCKRKQYIECFKVKGNCSTLSDNEKTCVDNEESTEPGSTTTPCTLQITTDAAENANENISDEASGYLRELDNIPCEDVIQIRAGSLYPSFTEEADLLVIPRVLNILPRTESVEVQPSSASAVEEEAYCHNSDESLSLVDSLDDPNIDADNETSPPSPTQDNNENCEPQPSSSKGKSKAFFVPIVDLGHENVENIPDVSETMPEKLKERIEQRQIELDAKKECYKKAHHSQPTFEEFHNIKSESDVTAQNRLKPKKCLLPLEAKSQGRSSKDSKELLRNDIGLLESYTIDSRGNLKFLPPQKAKLKAGNSHKSKIVKKQNIVTYRPPKSIKTSSSSSSYTKKHKVSPKDIQKMTIFQTQSDIITPDHENGPKRIYQKTEIQDGEKRIEILEIVECIESSDENSPVRQTRPKYIAKSASLRRSRIPVPIYKIGRSAGCQKPVRHRDTCHIFGHAVHRDIPQSISPKVDKAIADLLMGALNRSDQTVIEVLRSPREILSSRASRGQIISKRNTPKRSSSSGKYRQVFEVIPEEKSSLSMDSSNEESSKDARNSEEKSSISSNATGSITSNTNTTKPIITSTTFTTTSPTSAKTPSRGREAVESIEPKAWVGFLNTQESFVEEDDGSTQPYPSSTTGNSYYTITSISTAAATQGTQTPRNASVPRTSSAGSDCVLEVIRKSSSGFENTEYRGEFPSKQGTKSPATLKNRNIIQVRECKNMNVHENLNTSQEDKNSVDGKLMHHEPCNQSDNVGVWRVQSPDTCMRAKSKTCSEYHKCPADCETAEIDSRSFIICSDDSAINNSDQTSTTQNDLQECTKVTKEASNVCLTCCFCNPDLHHAKSINSEHCLYCNRKKTPQKKEEETNTESDFFTKEQDIYQTTFIKDHRHTMSRDSDSVSTKCTKTNEKIKRYIPDSSRASSESCSNPKKNLNRPKNINNLPKFEKKPVSKVTKDTLKEKSSSKKSEEFENKLGSFPSPYKQFSSCGYDRSSSPTSSSDTTCPTTPERRLLFPKVKCRNSRGKVKKGNEAVVKDLKKGTNTENKTPVVETNSTNAGWTVTLAGTCTQGPPPDVEMRLSFPKDTVTTAMNKIEGIGDKNLLENLSQNDLTYDRNGNARRHSVLPPAGNTDSRRTLPNTQTGSSFQRDLIFPEMTIGTPPQNQVVPRHVTTKKAIRHLECNVAVTSATRTVSNITRGRRTMSYQTLNTGEPQKYSSRERQLRDSSLDLGFLSSRRMSFGSQSPLETMALSIMGNAIAPEQKPRVPTMSEKDLTRRHNRCFTRNRAFFT